MLQTVAGSGLKCQDFRGRQGIEERQDWVVVRTVCSEPVSRVLAGNFPVKQGQNKEFR